MPVAASPSADAERNARGMAGGGTALGTPGGRLDQVATDFFSWMAGCLYSPIITAIILTYTIKIKFILWIF